MHLHYRNVNDAFAGMIRGFSQGEWPIGRRHYSNPNGTGVCLEIEEPVTITYSHPRERVLFNAVRDANPFFHLYEALWMLAGRNDVAPLAYYNSRISQFSDDGRTFNGAYGYRWRHSAYYEENSDPYEAGSWRHVDQLDLIADHLRHNPTSRRAVLSMWNVEDDLLKLGTMDREHGVYDATGESKDVCCNLSVMFSLRNRRQHECQDFEDYNTQSYALDMTVTNRSNDTIWGALGANYVHFTVLQEYMAARIGVVVGRYHHVSNNMHVYENRADWDPEKLLAEYGQVHEKWQHIMTYEHANLVPLVHNPEAFERELPLIVEQYSGGPMRDPFQEYTEPFLRDVAQPMFDTWLSWKGKTATVMNHCARIAADDWRIAATAWLEKRRKGVIA